MHQLVEDSRFEIVCFGACKILPIKHMKNSSHVETLGFTLKTLCDCALSVSGPPEGTAGHLAVGLSLCLCCWVSDSGVTRFRVCALGLEVVRPGA